VEAAHALKTLSVLASVCCLECGEIYSKPVAGGTVEKNPGCPDCGYVGWIPLSLPERTTPRRPAAGQRLFPLARSH
jgi:predicted  nucleic acid-binding Zn-ribbon protein